MLELTEKDKLYLKASNNILREVLQTNITNFEIDYKALHYNLVPYLRGNDALKDIIQLEKTLKDMKKNIKTINKIGGFTDD